MTSTTAKTCKRRSAVVSVVIKTCKHPNGVVWVNAEFGRACFENPGADWSSFSFSSLSSSSRKSWGNRERERGQRRGREVVSSDRFDRRVFGPLRSLAYGNRNRPRLATLTARAMSGKLCHISPHARFEMQRRGISGGAVIAVVQRPEQVLPSRKGRSIHQSRIGPAGPMLLRVVVKEVATRIMSSLHTKRPRSPNTGTGLFS